VRVLLLTHIKSLIALLDYTPFRSFTQLFDEKTNVALVRQGYLGCSPIDPSVAISLDCLELYHQIRRRQSSFSIQSMAKVFCAMHNVCV
jgi:hypothetical protein